jgi:hypothetical protein
MSLYKLGMKRLSVKRPVMHRLSTTRLGGNRRRRNRQPGAYRAKFGKVRFVK